MVTYLEIFMARTCVDAAVIDYVSPISFPHFERSEYVKCLLTFKLYNGSSLFGYVVFVALVCKWHGAGIYDCVNLICFRYFLVSESVICLPTVEISDCASLFRLLDHVALVLASVSTGIIVYVCLISVLRFVLSECVRVLLTFDYYDCASLFGFYGLPSSDYHMCWCDDRCSSVSHCISALCAFWICHILTDSWTPGLSPIE